MSDSHAISGWASDAPTPAQLVEFFSQIKNGRITKKRLQELICGGVVREPVSWHQATQIVYELCNLGDEFREAIQNFDFTDEEGFWKCLMVKGLTHAKIVKAYEKAGVPLELYGRNLEEVIDKEKEQRCPSKGSYLVKFHNNMEAEPSEGEPESANMRKEKGCQDDTLLERLFVGLVVFLTGQGHLDREVVTLCAGSRDSGGGVPFVFFFSGSGRVRVVWRRPANRLVDLRARSASFPS